MMRAVFRAALKRDVLAANPVAKLDLDAAWGLRGVRMKGGKKRDIPLPAAAMQFLRAYVDRFLVRSFDKIEPDTPLF